MKKTILLIAFAILTTGIMRSQDKAFEKGNITFDLGAGFGLYGTKTHIEENKYAYVWNGTGIEKVVVGKNTKDTTDGAGAGIFPLKVEYGVTNWLGIAARFAYSNWITERDSVSGLKAKATSFDAGVMVNFHLVKSKRFDMPVSLTLGYSSFKYLSNDPLNGMAKDNGINYGIGLLPRIYFGDHVGMCFNIGYAGYSYPSLHFSNSNDSNLNDDNGWKQSIKGGGINLGIGLIGKF